MFVLAKFQPHILKAIEVKALQSSVNRKINVCSKYRENKLQVHIKTDELDLKFAPLCSPWTEEWIVGYVIPSTALKKVKIH